MTKKKSADKEQDKPKEKGEKIEELTIEASELEKLRDEIAAYKDKNLRVLAESENTRKRLQKEKIEMQAYARESIVCEFLTPIDQFENALSFKEQQSDEVKNWMVGFEMILAQFRDVLSQNEIRPIEAVGKMFDPFYHEAMEMVETDEAPPNTILGEYVKGYMMGEKVIRPAKVKVAKTKTPEPKKEEQDKKKSTETINQKEV